MKRFFVFIGLVTVIGGGGYLLSRSLKYQKETVPEQMSIQQVLESAELRKNSEMQEAGKLELPPSLNLEAPFYSQAPFGNWDYPWQEACEEAAVLLAANAYFDHQWTKEQFNEEILAIVDWEIETFGYYEHTNVDQTAYMLEEYLGLETVIHEDPTLEDVQKILASGHLMVMPFAGKELENPFFTNGGPNYHVMLIKGYKEGEKIITHEVGTRRGEDYVYSWDVIENSLHDYAEPIQKGAKRFIEVLPPQN